MSGEQAGRDQVADGSLDALVVGDGKTVRVVVKKDLDDNLRNAFNVLAGQVALNQEIVRLGGDPAQVNAAVADASVDVEELEEPYPYDPQQLVLGIIAGILIYMSLLLNGQMVAQGVVEEKSSRVVELLLSTIRPWQLMAGKVLGIGLVGLMQMVVIGGVGVIAALRARRADDLGRRRGRHGRLAGGLVPARLPHVLAGLRRPRRAGLPAGGRRRGDLARR